MSDKSHILVIDDEKNYLLVLQTLLEDEGYTVTAISDPETALAFLAESEVDVVVTDISMPGLSGLELCERIRARWPLCRVVMLTGYRDFEYACRAVELGVYQVIPVAMKRSVVRLDDKKAAKKADRWNSIAESAAKQAGRSRIPEVTMPLSYNEALKMAEELDVTLLPYELAGGMEVTREVIRQIKSGQSVGIFIGPEGGFEPEEVDAAVSMGAKVITLGRRILRTETAGLAMLAVLMFELEQ